ncbi:unnamed protein product [Penicillium nalgiovense]|uniref:Uncharacterized protein n=1 Tax=Penicillium nalgiovense TaxID=60175 RepID=A0A9W4MKF1_PENNA|nr:unnamed protein product [Penicillium nalgiovense]CAG7960803.1 unnamed protein product [Penicillium nalgiovense]CAG7970621.1 unnamed protein product [Penicillium nalgiovense]CAG7971549.1 unnamed protein product [Penicillium nalgiovense]CAG7975948.1 unnamed protein product [Penicillium nalgiovense]
MSIPSATPILFILSLLTAFLSPLVSSSVFTPILFYSLLLPPRLLVRWFDTPDFYREFYHQPFLFSPDFQLNHLPYQTVRSSPTAPYLEYLLLCMFYHSTMSDGEAQATGSGTKAGPGARSNRDWDEVGSENPSDEDQSTDLPEPGSFSIFCPVAPLEKRGDFDGWFTAIEKSLRPNLHRLLDATIKRPRRDSPNAEKWMQLSLKVRAWLASKMDAKVVQEIMAQGGRVTFADEFMTETRKVMRDEGHTALSAAILRLVRTTRSEFNSTEEFINALEYRYKVTIDLKGQVPPYTALIIMFQELRSVSGFETIINIWNGELCRVKDPAANITYADFLAYGSAVVTEARGQLLLTWPPNLPGPTVYEDRINQQVYSMF